MGGAGARLPQALREARAAAEVRLLSAARDRRAGVAGLGLEPRAQPGRGRGCDLRHRDRPAPERAARSEEHTSELQSLMRISSAVFCLKKKTTHTTHTGEAHNKQTQLT